MHDYFWFSLFVAANGLLLLALAANVSLLRMKYKIAHGFGENKHLMKAIRVHSNGIEQVPIYGLEILALTFLGSSNLVLGCLVAAFTVSRFIHAYGMLFRSMTARQIGAGVTYLLQGVAVAVLLINLTT